MSQSEQIRKKIMEMISANENQRQRPYLVVKTVSSVFGVPSVRVKEMLEDLLKERKLVYTYRDPCSYIEIPFNDLPTGTPHKKVVVNGKGTPWICELDVDPSKNLAVQGCWQLGQEDSN